MERALEKHDSVLQMMSVRAVALCEINFDRSWHRIVREPDVGGRRTLLRILAAVLQANIENLHPLDLR